MFLYVTTATAASVGSILLFAGTTLAAQDDSDQCQHEICPIDDIDTSVLAQCLADPTKDAAMREVYDSVINLNLEAGANGDATNVLAGLNAINSQSGATISAEGLSFCLAGDAFYWSPDCEVASVLCRNRTAAEIEMGAIGYVVDAAYHGDDLFHRYAFNETDLVETEFQSPTLGAGYQCTTLVWFQTGMCTGNEGLSLTCPEETVDSPNPFYNGWNAGQYYGDSETVVVGQQLRNMDLATCLNNLGNIAGNTTAPEPVLISTDPDSTNSTEDAPTVDTTEPAPAPPADSTAPTSKPVSSGSAKCLNVIFIVANAIAYTFL